MVSGGDGANLFYLSLIMVMVLAGIVARRPPLGQTLRMGLVWAAIFAVGLMVFSQRERYGDLRWLWADQTVTGGETRIRQSGDGHFYADVRINGIERRLLVDSGATTTALSEATAQAAGVDTASSPFPAILSTANGTVVARTGTAATVIVGSIEARDLSVVVAPEFGDGDVLGMNFLSRLASWRVEGQTLVLVPERP